MHRWNFKTSLGGQRQDSSVDVTATLHEHQTKQKLLAGLTIPSLPSSGIGRGLAGTRTFQGAFRCLNGWDFDSGHKNV